MTADTKAPDFFEYVDNTQLCPVSKSILAKDINSMKRLLHKRKKNPAPLPADNRGWTALHVAASADEYADYLQLLLRSDDSIMLDINATTFEHKTALYMACERDCVKNCSILLEAQCNPELSAADVSSPLHVASMKGHVAIVSQLLARDINVNGQDVEGFTPLHLAAMNGHVEVVQQLMMSEAISIFESDGHGNIPLHLACRNGHFEITKILLHTGSSRIDWRNHAGFTPLMLAVQSHCVKCVEYLLSHGANAEHCSDEEVISLQYAALSGVKEILELVLQSTSRECIQKYCMLRIEAVLLASEGIFHSLMACVIKSGSPECMSVLLESGLPRSILEAPYIESVDDVFWVYSPLAYLFSTYSDCTNSRTLDQFLRLLLQHDITYMNEFNATIELKSPTLILRYVNPFTDIFDAEWSATKRYHYLNTLIENGVTTDYCLQCYIERPSKFDKFDIIDLQRFYEPVTKAIHEDKVDIVKFFIVNSAILEPAHLWNYLNFEILFAYGTRRPKVLDYLMQLRVFSNAAVYADVRKIIDYNNRSTLCSQYEAIGNINLQQLCRQAIRSYLRDETIEDNLKNFRRKLNALPLPNLLKNYLRFNVK